MKDRNIVIKNIYHMLSYSYTILQQDVYKDIALEKFDNIYGLLASILSKGISYQLKQGLYKEYINKEESIPVIRGKILISGTIRNKLARKQLVDCEFDELSENNIFNQILKSTSKLLIKELSNNDKELKDELRKEMFFFSNIDEVDLRQIRFDRIIFHKHNQNYRMLIGICRLIVEGLLLSEEDGDHHLASFIYEKDMCDLYERFLREYFSKEFPELSVNARQISWSLDDDNKEMLPKMQTDITIEKGNNVLIIDAKYYQSNTQVIYDKHSIVSGNLYQIFTYVKNREYNFGDKEHKVSGMLLYAKTDEEIQPNAVYHMHGNQIEVKTIDLNMEFKYIKEQLNKIVQDYF